MGNVTAGFGVQVKQVCGLVARRSAALVAACLAGLLRQIDRDGLHMRMQPTTIAVDGGLFEHYTSYRGYLREYLDQLLGRQVSALAIRYIRRASAGESSVSWRLESLWAGAAERASLPWGHNSKAWAESVTRAQAAKSLASFFAECIVASLSGHLVLVSDALIVRSLAKRCLCAGLYDGQDSTDPRCFIHGSGLPGSCR